MESNFNNREFEQYVKKNADQYRMIPSEKVWKGINNVLHTRRRWYGIGLTLLLLLTAVSVTWVMVSYPVSKMQATVSAVKSTANESVQPVNANSETSGSPLEKSINNLLSFKTGKHDNINTIQPVDAPVAEPVANLLLSPDTKANELFLATTSAAFSARPTTAKNEPISATGNKNDNSFLSQDNTVESPGTPVITIVDLPATADKPTVNADDYPMTIESVVNSFQAKKLSRRVIWQIYFMPTVSYRKLSENKSYESTSANYPFASSSDINRAVTHKSDMGIELGVAAKYPLSNRLKLTGGFQFNVNRYDIKAAYLYRGEQATINLNGGNGSDLVTTWTNYRNYNGSKSDWLKNLYFSVSAPVGAELKVLGNSKTYFGVAGTVQPTYIIGDRAYLLSTDYKNYAEVPGLIRHVNINTSFETFISYSSRTTRWQIGPQIRYQALSSFKDKYPVKENLFDYGIKIGITLNP